jgi:hypothetical protein
MKSDIVHRCLNQPRLAALKNEPASEALRICTARVRELDTLEKTTFIERGMILAAVEDNEWWKADPSYTSFDDWLIKESPVGRSSSYAAKSTFKSLKEAKIPWEDVKTIPRCNLQIVAKLSPKVARKESTLKAAKELPEKEFRAHVANKHPDQHVEAIDPVKLKFTESQRTIWDGAIAMAMKMGAKDEEEAAELIAAHYLEANQPVLAAADEDFEEAIQ